jgi:hypothetical protein
VAEATLPAAKVAPAADGNGYPIVLSLMIQGSDGTLSAEMEIRMPIVPYAGMGVDLFDVEKVSWSARRQAFIARLVKIRLPERPARETLKLLAAGDAWKDILFFEKK